ncbi:hypothetical protein EC919_105224 [Pseudomonas graminis]|nr:hypothetical protein EC919_105224 [Pseudomonas graminis]
MWTGHAPTCRTGFSRESVGSHTAKLTVYKPASSRLKPAPLKASWASSGIGCDLDSGTGFSRESVGSHAALL